MKIEINVGKKHIAVIIAAMLLISALTFVSLVIAKTPGITEPYEDADPPPSFHETLYVDTIAGKSDEMVTVDDNMDIIGDLRYDNAVVGGCSDACSLDSALFYSCGNEWGKGRCGGSLVDAVGTGGCTAVGGSNCGCDEGHKMVVGGMLCWTPTAGYSSTCYTSICLYP